MSSRVRVAGHITDPVPLIKKSRALCPGGRFPPSSIHQVMIITGLNNYNYMTVCSRPEDGLRCRQGVKPPLKLTEYLVPLNCLHITSRSIPNTNHESILFFR